MVVGEIAVEAKKSYYSSAMKHSTKLFFAIISTMLLCVGATRAAEKFDVLVKSDQVSAQTTAFTDPPTTPCVEVEN